jgi:serine phosphatase RsbU (regulator of sigma subunit)
MKEKILLVDDEENVLNALKRALRDKYTVFTCSSAHEGLEIIRKDGPFAVVVSDYRMPGMDGATFLSAVREINEDTIRMMLSGKADLNDTIQSVNEGRIFRFLAKPCPVDVFETSLEGCVAQYRLINGEKEARRQEAAIAGKIQSVLLIEDTPKNLTGVDLAAVTIPSVIVDGDFIDFFVYSEKCFDIVLGDVMGKGIHAALIAAAARNRLARALNILLMKNGCINIPSTHAIVEEVSREMSDKLMSIESFLTMVVVRFDLEKMILEFTDCGHTPGILFRSRTEGIELIKGNLPPIGFPMIRTFKSEKIALEKGDIVFLYSDGLVDARNEKREFFGIDRISALISENRKLSSAGLIEKICESVKKFADSETMDDDLTAIMVKI